MTLHRFFVRPDEMAGPRFALPDEIGHQVLRVLRMRSGDRFVLLDGRGQAAMCRLEGDECVVEERGPAGGEPGHRLTVWQALLRGDHLEPVVRHATEVGVAEFRLFVSERCVVRDLSPRRLERLRGLAREAAEQSERGMVPPVHEPVRLADAIGSGSVLLLERASAPRLSEIPSPPGVIIGPEGGFSEDEVHVAVSAGTVTASLGSRILRSETVAVAAAAVVLSRTGDFA
ncbi:MAG TPA: RsmE family RNA methyltransferase [Candidatus Limnocylindria bacterium]|nr:RsmE family RNA methyltransferase [Candidatus Limnocylindria bacterium]